VVGGVKLITHLYLVPRLKMCTEIYPFPKYVFMAWRIIRHRDNFCLLLYGILHTGVAVLNSIQIVYD